MDKMISMATHSIISAIGGKELSIYAVVFLLLLLSIAEILDADPDIRKRFAPFMDICNAFIVPLLTIFIMTTITKVIMVL
ncbi:hypothetical protein C5S42_02845 [Candidatus Methanomarinus sp.]|nr:hypothetical protein C5S42_02845 [ANME-2 cluster archaeon]